MLRERGVCGYKDGIVDKMKKTDTYERVIFIDVLKSIACLCVLVGHVINGLIKDGMTVPDLLRMVNSYVYLFHVPCFFFASGYLYANKRLETWNDYLQFILRKLIVLGLPYVICSVAYILFSSAMSADMHTAYSFDAILSLAVAPVAQYWYLYALFEMFLIVPVVERLFRKIGEKWILLGFIICALVVHADAIYVEYVMMYTCFFYMGVYFNRTGVMQKGFFVQKSSFNLFVVGCVFSITVYAVYQMIAANTSFIDETGYVFKGITKILLVITIVWASYAVSRMHNVISRSLIWLSQYALYVYLFHTWFSGTLRVLLRKAGVTNSWVQVVCGIAVGLAGSLVAAVIIRKVPFFRFWFEPSYFLNRRES